MGSAEDTQDDLGSQIASFYTPPGSVGGDDDVGVINNLPGGSGLEGATQAVRRNCDRRDASVAPGTLASSSSFDTNLGAAIAKSRGVSTLSIAEQVRALQFQL